MTTRTVAQRRCLTVHKRINEQAATLPQRTSSSERLKMSQNVTKYTKPFFQWTIFFANPYGKIRNDVAHWVASGPAQEKYERLQIVMNANYFKN